MAFTVRAERPRSGTDASVTPEVTDEEAVDFTPLVLGALNAAGVVLAGNAVVTVLVANIASVTTEIRFLWSCIPYVALVADASRFVTVTTLAAVVGAVGLGAWLVASAHRSSLDRLARAGRLSAVPMAAAIGALQWVRLRSTGGDAGSSLRWLLLAVVVLALSGAVAGLAVRRAFRLEEATAELEADRRRTLTVPSTVAPPDPASSAAAPVAPTGFRRHLRLPNPSQEAHR